MRWVAHQSISIRIEKAEHSSVPYTASALARLRQAIAGQSASESREQRKPELQETDAQRKARMREEAKARQLAIQKKMQESRAQFAQANEKDLAESTSQNRSAEVEQCVLCHESSSSSDNPLCSLILLQKFSVVEECCSNEEEGKEADTKRVKLVFKRPDVSSLQPRDDDSIEVALSKCEQRFRNKLLDQSPPELSLRSCNHILHMNCYHRFFAQFYGRGGQDARDNGIDANMGEFVCPLCQSLCNTVVPIISVPSVSQVENTLLLPVEFIAAALKFSETSVESSIGDLSLASMRAGMLLWGFPPPTASSVLLYDAPMAMALADELTMDEGTRDQMMKQVMLGCQVLGNASSKGDPHSLKAILSVLLSGDAGMLDPLLTFGRVLLSLPSRLRQPSVGSLACLCRRLCVLKNQDETVLTSRIASVLDGLGLETESVATAAIHAEERNKQCLNLLSVTRCESSSFHQRLSLQLASLPQCLQDKEWFTSFIQWKCGVCGTVPSHPAICLLCSARVCKNGNCCRVGGHGECWQHANSKHGGIVLFFDVQDNTVLISRGESGCITNSPYLDAYGEQDIGLRRGRPVYLHAPMLEDLRRRFICGCLIDKTINTGMRLLLPSWRTF